MGTENDYEVPPTLILFAMLWFAPLAMLPAAEPGKPNVLIILADDLGRGDYSAFGTATFARPTSIASAARG